MPAPDLFLGGRTELTTIDFDGRVRSCWVIERLDTPTQEGSAPRHFLRVRVEPPLPSPGGPTEEVVLGERHAGTDITNLGDDWIQVYVYDIAQPDRLRDGRISEGALEFNTIGEVARMVSLLPETPDEFFERNFRLLERFVERTGHVDVPDGHYEQGQPLAVWLSNVRWAQAQGDLRPDWTRRLEALPGWRWLPGDDLYLLRRYAMREGTTDVPTEHTEEGRPLGLWVRLQREDHRKGVMDEQTRRQLESVPNWHW